MSAKKLAIVALAATALGATACGGSSKAGPTATSAAGPSQSTTAAQTAPVGSEEIKIATGTPLARAVWIARGNAICKRTNDSLSTTTLRTRSDYARLLPQIAAYYHAQAVELAKLVPSQAMASGWQRIVADLQKIGELAVKFEPAAQGNSNATASIYATVGRISNEVHAIAKRDGFKVCSQP
jgi:hypothetical protein